MYASKTFPLKITVTSEGGCNTVALDKFLPLSAKKWKQILFYSSRD
jgi:hypothetical protein